MPTYNIQIPRKTISFSMPEGWEKDSLNPNGGHPAKYLGWANTKDYIGAVDHLLAYIPPGAKVLEFCGGFGLIARTVWDLMKPSRWVSVEIDPGLTKHFLVPEAEVLTMDMYEYDGWWGADLVMFDISDMTLGKLMRGHPYKKMLDRIASHRPEYLYVADVGPYWVHLKNHHPIYKEYFGLGQPGCFPRLKEETEPTRGNYPTLLDIYYSNEFGYSVVDYRVCSGAGFFLLKRKD